MVGPHEDKDIFWIKTLFIYEPFNEFSDSIRLGTIAIETKKSYFPVGRVWQRVKY